MIDPNSDKLWYQANLDVFLNRWFANYQEARQALDREGGFLLPYRKHFFVCEADVIQALGLEPDDPDWERIGRDGAQPIKDYVTNEHKSCLKRPRKHRVRSEDRNN